MMDTSKNSLDHYFGQSLIEGPVEDKTGVGYDLTSDLPLTTLYNQFKFAVFPSNVLTSIGRGKIRQAESFHNGQGTIGYFDELLSATRIKEWSFEHAISKRKSDAYLAASSSKVVLVVKSAKGSTTVNPSLNPDYNWSVSSETLNRRMYQSYLDARRYFDELGEDFVYTQYWTQIHADFSEYNSERATLPIADTTYVQEYILRQRWWKKKTGVYPRVVMIPSSPTNSGKEDMMNEVYDYLAAAVDENGDSYRFEIPFTRTAGTFIDDWRAVMIAKDDSGEIDSSTGSMTIDQTHWNIAAKISGGDAVADYELL